MAGLNCTGRYNCAYLCYNIIFEEAICFTVRSTQDNTQRVFVMCIFVPLNLGYEWTLRCSNDVMSTVTLMVMIFSTPTLNLEPYI